MDKTKKLIRAALEKHNIVTEISLRIDHLLRDKKINEFMGAESIFTSFLFSMAEENGVFKRLISNPDYVYDIEVYVRDDDFNRLLKCYMSERYEKQSTGKIEYSCYDTDVITYSSNKVKHIYSLVFDKFKDISKYVYVSYINKKFFIGIKLAEEWYTAPTTYSRPLLPYYMLVEALDGDYCVSNIDFTDIVFETACKLPRPAEKIIVEPQNDLIDPEKELGSAYTEIINPSKDNASLNPDHVHQLNKKQENISATMTNLGSKTSLCTLIPESHVKCFDSRPGYQLKFTDYRTTERNKYTGLVSHLHSLRLPLKIIDDEWYEASTTMTNTHNVYIRLEDSSSWPSDPRARACAKTSFYCLIFRNSKFKYAIDHSSVVLKYKGSYWCVQILHKTDTQHKLQSMISKAVSGKNILVDNIKYIKKFLGAHGYYPLHITDTMIDLISIVVGHDAVSFPRFFRAWSRFNWKLGGKYYDIEQFVFTTPQSIHAHSANLGVVCGKECVYARMPEDLVIKRCRLLFRAVAQCGLRLVDKSMEFQTWKLLVPSFKEYDFVLCEFYRTGFKKIKSLADTNDTSEKRDDGPVIGHPITTKILTPRLMKKAYIFYSEDNKVLMVKMREGNDPVLFYFYLLVATSYKYILINN